MKEKITKLINFEDYAIFEQYRNELLSLSVFCNSHCHGIDHSLRVLLLMIVLCKEHVVSSLELKLLYFAAVYHDVGRGDFEAMDPTHGMKSWKVISSTMKLSFSRTEQCYLKYIIENHCFLLQQALKNVELYVLPDKEKAKKLITLLIICDQLDMFRYEWFNSSEILDSVDDSYIELSKSLIAMDITKFKMEG